MEQELLFPLHGNRSETGKAERPRGCRSYVDDAPADKGPAVVDRDHNRASIAAIGDFSPRSQRQRPGCRGQRARIQSRTTRGS